MNELSSLFQGQFYDIFHTIISHVDDFDTIATLINVNSYCTKYIPQICINIRELALDELINQKSPSIVKHIVNLKLRRLEKFKLLNIHDEWGIRINIPFLDSSRFLTVVQINFKHINSPESVLMSIAKLELLTSFHMAEWDEYDTSRFPKLIFDKSLKQLTNLRVLEIHSCNFMGVELTFPSDNIEKIVLRSVANTSPYENYSYTYRPELFPSSFSQLSMPKLKHLELNYIHQCHEYGLLDFNDLAIKAPNISTMILDQSSNFYYQNNFMHRPGSDVYLRASFEGITRMKNFKEVYFCGRTGFHNAVFKTFLTDGFYHIYGENWNTNLRKLTLDNTSSFNDYALEGRNTFKMNFLNCFRHIEYLKLTAFSDIDFEGCNNTSFLSLTKLVIESPYRSLSETNDIIDHLSRSLINYSHYIQKIDINDNFLIYIENYSI